MSIQHLKLDDINEQSLASLIDNGVSEGKTLDYKLELPGDSKDDRKEFLYDVTSFANASGGDIVYGISEKVIDGKNRGIPEKIEGIADNIDQTILKLEGVIRDGIEPRIIGHHFKLIPLGNGKHVLILRIPKSLGSPHAVTIYGGFRFYSRNSAGKYRLDVNELRSAFLNQYQIKEVLYKFITERVTNIVAGETPLPMSQEPKAILFLLPINRDQVIDLNKIDNNFMSMLKVPLHNIYNHKYNVDGILGWSGQSNVLSYTQVYRNATIEGVTSIPADGSKLYAKGVEEMILTFYDHYLRVLKDETISCPLLIDIQIHGVKGFEIPRGFTKPHVDPRKYQIDRDIIKLPEIIIEDYSVDLTQALRSCFDTLWQASGWPRSFSYDDKGNYKHN
jgi:hypothetical protein